MAKPPPYILRQSVQCFLGYFAHFSCCNARAVAAMKIIAAIESPEVACRILDSLGRRLCARFCHAAGGKLEQIQFLLGHLSVQTTERYLGCKQRFREAVNDRIGIEP